MNDEFVERQYRALRSLGLATNIQVFTGSLDRATMDAWRDSLGWDKCVVYCGGAAYSDLRQYAVKTRSTFGAECLYWSIWNYAYRSRSSQLAELIGPRDIIAYRLS